MKNFTEKACQNYQLRNCNKDIKFRSLYGQNYDIESQDDLKTSPNYLSDLLLDTANVPKNEIENFTSEVRNDVPQINARDITTVMATG